MEVFHSAFDGIHRHIESRKKYLKQGAGLDKSLAWDYDIEGAGAERAFAKYINVYYSSPINTFKEPDVGEWQVRWTGHERGCLVVKEGDSEDEPFVLVRGRSPRYEIIGWMRGKDAKQYKYKKSVGGNPPAYFVPEADLTKFTSG